MSHGIIKPIDQVLSIRNPEWHNLATVVSQITDAEIAQLCFPIIQGSVFTGPLDVQDRLQAITAIFAEKRNIFPQADIEAVRDLLAQLTLARMPHHQALVADMRDVRPDLLGTDNELVPLHIPKNAYQPITNRELWDTLKTALTDTGAEVTCAGTLEAGKKFFVSVELKGESEMSVTVNGRAEKFLANLNFVTSHDGTLAAQAYDSTVRIVCMNTLRWSLAAAGEVGFKVYHTSGAQTAISNMGELLNSILLGRAEFRNAMEYLGSVAMDARAANEIALGYLLQGQESDEASTRTLNAAEAIATLFSRGIGNVGRTAFDLLNGATEYWTHGDGTGKKADKSEKGYKAAFGTAADHKSAFCNLLMADADTLASVREIGHKALNVALK